MNYTKHIKETTEKCSLCQENSAALSTENFKYISTVPPHPWHTLGTDLFYFRKQDFLILIDYFLIVRKLPNSTSNAVIKELELIFTEFGKPFILCSDNRPCYVSQEFQFFMNDWNIKSITSSPYFDQSNGLTESMVKTSKNLIEKSLQLNKPWFYLLHEHHIAPISENIPSPSEILFGQRMRSNLFIIPSQLMNPWISKQWEKIAKKENKLYTTGHIDTEMDLEVSQPIWHQDPHMKKWNTGTIHKELEEPHSYTIQDSAGQYYRQNWNWIKPRQVDETDLLTATELTEQVAGSDSAHSHSSPEASASGPATRTPVDAIPTVESTILQNPISARGTPVSHTLTPRPRISTRVNKGVTPR